MKYANDLIRTNNEVDANDIEIAKHLVKDILNSLVEQTVKSQKDKRCKQNFYINGKLDGQKFGF